MKPIRFIGLVALIAGCSNRSNKMADCLQSDKGIILSSVRCGCMEKLLEEYARRYGFLSLPIYTDTNYLEKRSILKSAWQLSQLMLDSLYKENYNIILFKKMQGKVEYRVINTDEVLAFKKIREEFFGGHLMLEPEH